MKIYFAGSITGGRGDQEIYFSIIEELKKHGEVLTEHISDKSLTDGGENLTPQYIFDRDVSWLKESDIIVAEITTPSLGVGYEIGLAESLGKKVICLYRKLDGKRVSSMITGNSYVKSFEYKSIENVSEILKKEMK